MTTKEQAAILAATEDITTRRKLFLQFTADHYNAGNRAVNAAGKCQYGSTATSEGCAIGRFCENASKMHYGLYIEMLHRKLIPAWMQSLGQDFLRDVQALHDVPTNWTNDGLSPRGQARAAEIRNEYDI